MPLVNRTFDQLIDFTRTSAGTFVNSSGNITSTAQSRNLLTFTQEFANAAWSVTGATVSANVTAAPDGTSTADKITPTASSSVKAVRRTVTSSGANTWSFYAKADGYTKVGIWDHAVTGAYAAFNLTGAGSVLDSGSGASGATITSVGNGWYRCSFTATASGTIGFSFQVLPDAYTTGSVNNPWTGNGTFGVFLWGSQLEQSATLTDYTRNFGGLFPPRFDYNPTTLAPRGLLIEEQRTNLLQRSEEFDNAAWSKVNVTATANTTTSPGGTATADTLTATASTGRHNVIGSSASAAATCVASAYVKASTHSFFQIGGSSGGFFANFNVSTGVVGTGGGARYISHSIENVGNGWYRCVVVFTNATDAIWMLLVSSASAVGLESWTAAGTEAVFNWGAQLEDGAFATSYIPTVASQVTRSRDEASIQAPNFASWYNQSEGTFVADFDCFGFTANARIVGVSDGTASERFQLQTQSTTLLRFRMVDGGVDQATVDSAIASLTTGTHKGAIAYKLNDLAISTDGGAAVTDTSATIPTVTRLALGAGEIDNSNSQLNGHLRSLRYYPTRLTNAQLQALTA